jgi:hypothetical protein
LRFALALLLVTACDESPFGTRHAEPGAAILGKLQDIQCMAVSVGFPMTGLGNGTTDFFIASSNQQAPLLHAFTPSSSSLTEDGTPVTASEPIYDVAVKGSNCPYVSTNHNGTVPLRHPAASCGDSTQDPNYGVSPVVFAFDSRGTFYFARPDNGLFGTFDAAGVQHDAPDLSIHAVRLTINNTRNEIWIAYQPSSSTWDMLVFDAGTLKQTGHIQFSWPNGDLAGMEWNDNDQTLVALANQPTPVICSGSFAPATL